MGITRITCSLFVHDSMPVQINNRRSGALFIGLYRCLNSVLCSDSRLGQTPQYNQRVVGWDINSTTVSLFECMEQISGNLRIDHSFVCAAREEVTQPVRCRDEYSSGSLLPSQQ